MRAKTNIVWFSVYFLVLFFLIRMGHLYRWLIVKFYGRNKRSDCFICLINDVFISMRVQNHKSLSFDFGRPLYQNFPIHSNRYWKDKTYTELNEKYVEKKVFLFQSRFHPVEGIIRAAKNQLSWLFGTHLPWLISLSFIVSTCRFIVEVELKSEIPI